MQDTAKPTHPMRILSFVASVLVSASSFAADVAPLIAKVDTLDVQGKNADALAISLEAEKLAPNDAEVLRRVAKQYAEAVLDAKGDAAKKAAADKSLDYAKRAVAAAPKNALARLSLAICYGRAATVSDAKTKIAYSKLIKEHADAALALDPNNDLTHFVLGSWCYEIANLGTFLRAAARVVYGALPSATNEDAAKFLERAVQLNPRRVCSHASLGRCYVALGQKDKAKQSFQRALALPDGDKGDDIVKKQTREALADL
jgi:hypothetical protein